MTLADCGRACKAPKPSVRKTILTLGAVFPCGKHIKTSLYVHCAMSIALVGSRHPLTAEGRNDRLRHRRYQACRLRPQRDQHRRNRNAGPDGDPRRIQGHAAAEGRARRRLAAHDDPDRRADRDPEVARRRRALGLLQHLFDAGPRRRRHRRRRHAGVRHQGREPEGLLGLHPPASSNGPTAAART